MSIIPITNYETNLNSTIAPPVDIGSLFIPVVSGSNSSNGGFFINPPPTPPLYDYTILGSPLTPLQYSGALFTPPLPSSANVLVTVIVYLPQSNYNDTAYYDMGIATNNSGSVGTLTQQVRANGNGSNNSTHNYRTITFSGVIQTAANTATNLYLVSKVTNMNSGDEVVMNILNGYWVYLGPG
jgi:hypothetical protein